MNEIAVTMSYADWSHLMEIMEQVAFARPEHQRQRVIDLTHRLQKNADKLSLNWLDKKRAEFP